MANAAIIDKVGTANIKDTLSDAEADAALWAVLRYAPQLLGLEEWDGPNPLSSAPASLSRDVRLERALKDSGYKFTRPRGGGNPVIYGSTRYGLLNCYGALLHKAGWVGALPGRKSTLPASVATVALFADLVLGGTTALVVIHLTAEVQGGRGGRYLLDPRHALRVLRHRRERRAARLLVLGLRREGHRVRVVGDTNFDDMPLPPLTSCWVGNDREEAAGTLGWRTVDYVYAEQPAARVHVIPNASDHDAVVAEYLTST
jgi:hypothetical protein